MNYAESIPARRDLISAAFRQFHVKDPIASMKKQERKFGPEIRDAFAFAYEVNGTACMAVQEERVDEQLSAKFGWKTMAVIRSESLEKLRADMADI